MVHYVFKTITNIYSYVTIPIAVPAVAVTEMAKGVLLNLLMVTVIGGRPLFSLALNMFAENCTVAAKDQLTAYK